MADEDQIKKFRENPELFRLHLLNKVKECNGGLKELMKDTVLDRNGLSEYLVTSFTKSVDGALSEAFKKLDLDAKMRTLRELEKNATGEAAWRPETGVVDLSGEKRKALLKRKKLLEAKTKQIDSEIEDMKAIIIEKRNDLKAHLTELQKRTDELNNLEK